MTAPLSTLYDLALGVGALLKEKHFPLPVVYGPEQHDNTAAGAFGNRIVIERDREQGDSWEAPHAARKQAAGAPVLATLNHGAKAMVFAQSTKPGARPGDHERLCDAFVAGLYCALFKWIATEQKWRVLPTSSGYVAAKTLGQEYQAWPGVVYVMRWRMPASVEDRNFAGEGFERGNVTSVGGVIQVTRDAGADPPVTDNVEIP